ncbi:sigma-70 family RNA polymerase sigma factor [Planctomycetota bacterium]|nr:sigma-70 family RNA polymerase sigma factor [Planctomycetota bacterium]
MGWFKTTLWTEVRAAGSGDAKASQSVVERYRPVVVAYLIKRGRRPDDAEDLAQDVLVRLFTRGRLAAADRGLGRFRSYLLGVARNVLRESLRREQAQKRGGGQAPLSLAELEIDPAQPESSDEAFDACWLEGLMSRALDRLQAGSPRHYDLLQRTLSGQTPAQIAAATERSAGSVRVDLHRARKKLGDALRAEIATYAGSASEQAEELALIVAHLGQSL